MSGYHLAQINVGRFIHERGDPANADFMNGLDPVNAHAEAAPGFIWRLIGDGNDATDLVPDASDPQLLVNMSLWRDVDALGSFVYRQSEVFMALWWVPAGHIPSVAEGMEKIALLKAHGPSADAFTFRQPFAAPDGMLAHPVLDECA
jgi:hypothetical protein